MELEHALVYARDARPVDRKGPAEKRAGALQHWNAHAVQRLNE